MTSADPLRILVVARSADREAVIRAGLESAGHASSSSVTDMGGLAERAAAGALDLLIIDLERPAPADMDDALKIVRAIDRPVVIFVDSSTRADTRAAMEAGVSAYIIGDLRAERIKPIIDMAVSRFETQKHLVDRLASTEQALRDRKIIERAKGVLMSRNRLTEDEAYRLLRRTAMNQKRSIADVARNVVNAADLLD